MCETKEDRNKILKHFKVPDILITKEWEFARKAVLKFLTNQKENKPWTKRTIFIIKSNNCDSIVFNEFFDVYSLKNPELEESYNLLEIR